MVVIVDIHLAWKGVKQAREGSDVACTEGICNHDEHGDDSCVHHCEDKEDDGDSCVECWANSEENSTKGKIKRRKRKARC